MHSCASAERDQAGLRWAPTAASPTERGRSRQAHHGLLGVLLTSVGVCVGILVLSLFGAVSAAAGDLDFSGAIEAEVRGFLSEARSSDQLDDDQVSLVLAPEVGFRSDSGNHQFRFAPFLRLDGRDDERSHFDVRQAYWRFIGDGWESVIGIDRVFWGVTESRHLVDIVNQTDTVEDVDEEDKLGQPMIALTSQRSWGSVSLYLLLGFRERTFAGTEGRLRPALVVDTDDVRYESAAEDERLDLALRWSHYVGDWDLGVSYFHGTGREPRLVPAPEGDRLLPFYDVIQQLAIDVQNTRGAWLLKLEALVREGQGRTFGAAVAGFEYTLFQVKGAADVGLLVEYLWDDREPDPLLAPVTAFEDDIFAGARLALNDTQNTRLLVGAVVDRDDRSWAVFVEAARRLTDHLSAVFESRLFFDVPIRDPLAALAQDDFASLSVAYSF